MLFKTINCCESQIVPVQDHYKLQHTQLRKGVTGLAGGINNNGSTCGVVIGGALNLAALYQAKAKEIFPKGKDSDNEDPILDEIRVMQAVHAYVRGFEQKFGSCLCRERTGLDFRKLKGKIGLLIPSRAKGCVQQTGWAMHHVTDWIENPLKTSDQENHDVPKPPYTTQIEPNNQVTTIDYCTTALFQFAREHLGIEEPEIEHLAQVLSGGVGFGGSGCGALTSALILLGLKCGNEDLGESKRRNPLRLVPKKFDRAANKMIETFSERFGGMECSTITQQTFSNLKEFNTYRATNACEPLTRFLIEYLSTEIPKL